MSSQPVPTSQAHRQVRWIAPPGATEILLVRHGATIGIEGTAGFPLKDGHGDPPLSDDGEHQAKLVGTRLAQEHVDAIYMTSLVRTHQTAAPIEAALGLTATIEPDLREVFLGEWEGGEFRRRAAEGDPRFIAAMTEHEWGHIPGAETTQQLTDRCVGAINRIQRMHTGKRIITVVHGGVISAILGHAVSSRSVFLGADNCSISHLVIDGPKWIVRCFNDTAHLGGFTPETHIP